MEFEKVKAIIAEQMNIEEDKITPESSFTEDLGADSLDIFQIISELEEEFGIEVSTEDAEKIKTVGDAVNYISEKANG
ncbi:MAG: acyl carrier protein [Clostridiales bacterium]|jgi:acyl carrier protein|nr:acyl carrier protein [Clostridiales bacterium]